MALRDEYKTLETLASEWLQANLGGISDAAVASLAALLSDQVSAGRAEILAFLRGGPPSSWCSYAIREGLADECEILLEHAKATFVPVYGCPACAMPEGAWHLATCPIPMRKP